MSDDLISLVIYLALGLVGVIASAYKNKVKKQQQRQSSGKTHQPEVPHSLPADPEKDYGPELGPLMELFDLPRPKQEVVEYESIERGPSVEEAGMAVDTHEASQELDGMMMDTDKSSIDTTLSEVETFEEGQSDIQKMIAKYQAIRKELEDDGIGDDIASGEIVSIEAEEEARIKRQETMQVFDARKAIIYSEILKRKEY